PIFSIHHNILPEGNWEHQKNILHRAIPISEISKRLQLPEETIQQSLQRSEQRLFEIRSKRVPPSLDDKILTNWNGLMIKAYADAYRVFREPTFLSQAIQCYQFIRSIAPEKVRLNHTYKNGVSGINAYLEDYAAMMQAAIALYEVSFEEQYLTDAIAWAEYVIQKFKSTSACFYFTSQDDEPLITRKTEIYDNVIPSSNAMFAQALFRLGHYLDRQDLLTLAQTMLASVQEFFVSYAGSFSAWGNLAIQWVNQPIELCVVGADAKTVIAQIQSQIWHPALLFSASEQESHLPLLKHKFNPETTRIFVCRDKNCQKPTESVTEAIQQVKKQR
ncbi:MAG: thioredoxin domain-containing protein, partial [Bacteroidia bacterium]|nr:thioredoxin domain-containing protein [Bacteroidia bacterium]